MAKKRVFIIVAAVFAAAVLVWGCCGKNQANQQTADNKIEQTIVPKQSSVASSPYANVVLKLGRIPFRNSTTIMQEHEKLIEYLTKKLGVKQVRMQMASSYEGIVRQLINGDLDIAWLATMSSVEARNHPAIELLVKPVRFGITTYRGIIITRQDSGIRTLKDLKNKKFAWVEKDSASGYLFPKAVLLEAGVNPAKDFAESAFLNTHDLVVENVLRRKYDAGACYDDARKTLPDKSKIDDLTILATTQDISNEPIVVKKSLPTELKEKIKQALLDLNMKTPEGREVLKNLSDVQGFLPVKESDYDYVERVQKILEKHKD